MINLKPHEAAMGMYLPEEWTTLHFATVGKFEK